jgi:hypothetical protein
MIDTYQGSSDLQEIVVAVHFMSNCGVGKTKFQVLAQVLRQQEREPSIGSEASELQISDFGATGQVSKSSQTTGWWEN